MPATKSIAAALALGAALTLALAAGPAAARNLPARAGFDARAEALPGAPIGSRVEALRACNEQAASLREYTWGAEQSDRYRACMAGRGEPE